MQGRQGRICEIVLNVHRTNDDEVWHSNAKFRFYKIAHWKIYRWKEGKLEELVAKVLGLRWSLSNTKFRRSDMAQ